MSYFADSMRFVDVQFQALFSKFDMLVPDRTPTACRLPATGPPFPPRARSSVPPPRTRVDGMDPEEVASSEEGGDDDGDGDDGDDGAEE